jgi:hypothetical protein
MKATSSPIYLLPILYLTELTRDVQIILGLLVVLANAALYGWILAKIRHTARGRT